MKIFLPLGAMVAFAGLCCCCGDLGSLVGSDFDPDDFGASDWGGGGGDWGASADGRAMYGISAGERITILDISPDDAYYADRYSIIGKSCTTQEFTSYKEGGWQGGSVHCADGSEYYFLKAAVRDDGPDTSFGVGTASTPAPMGVATTAIPGGSRVKVIEISSEDAYYASRVEWVGKHCTTDDTTSYNGDGWHGGPVHCSDGSTGYFYKARLEVE